MQVEPGFFYRDGQDDLWMDPEPYQHGQPGWFILYRSGSASRLYDSSGVFRGDHQDKAFLLVVPSLTNSYNLKMKIPPTTPEPDFSKAHTELP